TRTLGILCPAVHHQGFSDAVGNGQERVEARRRVLEHEADLAAQWPELAFTNAEHLLPEYLQRPAAHPGEAGDRATDRRLARTTLTDEAEHFTFADLEADLVDGSKTGAT